MPPKSFSVIKDYNYNEIPKYACIFSNDASPNKKRQNERYDKPRDMRPFRLRTGSSGSRFPALIKSVRKIMNFNLCINITQTGIRESKRSYRRLPSCFFHKANRAGGFEKLLLSGSLPHLKLPGCQPEARDPNGRSPDCCGMQDRHAILNYSRSCARLLHGADDRGH